MSRLKFWSAGSRSYLVLTLAAGRARDRDLATMAQIVRNDGIHIGQRQGRMPLHDGFRSGTILEGPNDQLEQHARVADAQSAC